MNQIPKLLAITLFTFGSFFASAQNEPKASTSTNSEQEIEILQGEDEQLMLASFFGNPPGSQWISVRCGRSSTCYPPAGYKFRHFNTETRGGSCKGSQKRRVKQTKDFIKTSRKCSVVGRVFLWPAEYCKGNDRNCL